MSRGGLGGIAERSRERFEELAGRFTSRPSPGGPKPPRPALTEGYWQGLRELFTRDVTPEALRALLATEAQDTLRFLTREVRVDDLTGHPWHVRQTRTIWRSFLAIAYRLSPARRVLFAGAVIALALGWLSFLLYAVEVGPFTVEPLTTGRTWLLLSATALFFVLILELRDKLTLKGDLEVARQIQFGLLPFEPFEREGLRVVTTMRPANTVGGDYFDLIELGDGRVAIAVGDVAGKGMPAALLMALLQGSLRTLISAGFRGAELVAKLNAHLCASIPSNRLVTFFYGELEPGTGILTYVNAGHNPPFVLGPSGVATRLAATGMALGVAPEAPYEAMTLDLDPGDRLLLYTDGVTEATNPATEEEYGDVRLEAWVRPRAKEPGRALIDSVVADVLRFCGDGRPHDDMTLMCVDVGPHPAEPARSGA